MTATAEASSAWTARAADLVVWANRQVNRRDVFGGYLPLDRRGEQVLPDGTKQNWVGPYTRPAKKQRGKILLDDVALRRHFTATLAEHVVGLHSTSAENTSLWGGIDIDWHDENSGDPLRIAAAGVGWFGQLQGRGFHPLLTDSNGRGGLHLRMLFGAAIPTPRLFWYLRSLVKDFGDYGLANQPETFPKQSSVQAGKFGNWLRLPGRHHTCLHWSRVWGGSCWLAGHDAIDHLLGLELDPPTLIPKGIEWEHRVAEYMAKLPSGMGEGSGRDDVAFNFLAFLVRDLQLHDTDALEYCARWDRGNRPPKGPERLQEILKNVHEYGQRPYGHGRNGHGPAAQASSANGPGAEDATPEQPAAPPPDDIHLTDLGNARRVVQRHGQDLRYCWPWKSWCVWDGRRWKNDDTAAAVRTVKETIGDIYRWTASKIRELSAQEVDEARQEQLAKLNTLLRHCISWEAARRIGFTLDLMRSEPTIPILPKDIDQGALLLNVLNGTLDLRTGELRPHRREDYLTKLAPVEYDPEAEAPLWCKFLARIMAGKGDLVGYLQRVIGYCLTGDVAEQSIWFFHGTGANGKTTFLQTILGMMGDYALQAVSELLMARRHEAHPTERADLFGRRFVATIETDQGKRLAEALMKQLTGGDKVRARKMRQDFFEFDPTHKIILAANHKPTICGSDHAVWRRIKLVPFTVTISDAEKDKDLPEKLRAELPGILAWAVRGCLEWQRRGLDEPQEVKAATAAYQAEEDKLGEFIADCCFVHRDVCVKSTVLFEAFKKHSGETEMTQTAFGRELEARGFTKDKRRDAVYRLGLALSASSSGDGVDSL